MSKPAIIALALGLLASGCATHHGLGHPHGMPPGQAKKVAHAHGNGCGHVHIGGEWLIQAPANGHASKRGKGHKK